LIAREILVLSFIVNEKNRKKDGRCLALRLENKRAEENPVFLFLSKKKNEKKEFSPSLQVHVVFSIVDRYNLLISGNFDDHRTLWQYINLCTIFCYININI
jgi:hypothetical protein